jgi:hypothetical protein
MVKLGQGYTYDDIAYYIYWYDNDNRIRIEFIASNLKEIWLLKAPTEFNHNTEDKKVDLPLPPGFEDVQTIQNALPSITVKAKGLSNEQFFANRIANDLEAKGTKVIRGPNAIYNAELVMGASLPSSTKRMIDAKNQTMQSTSQGREKTQLPKPPKMLLGLNGDGKKRLRVLFEHTLEGLGIKVTSSLRIRAEEKIYQIDAKYRFAQRFEAIDKSVIELIKWIENNIYFKK